MADNVWDLTKAIEGHPDQEARLERADSEPCIGTENEKASDIAHPGGFRRHHVRQYPPRVAVEVEVPTEFQGNIIGELNRRRGMIQHSESDERTALVKCDVPLQNMFGFSTDLRSATQGKGEFTMEYKSHTYVPRDVQDELTREYQESLNAKKSK